MKNKSIGLSMYKEKIIGIPASQELWKVVYQGKVFRRSSINRGPLGVIIWRIDLSNFFPSRRFIRRLQVMPYTILWYNLNSCSSKLLIFFHKKKKKSSEKDLCLSWNKRTLKTLE